MPGIKRQRDGARGGSKSRGGPAARGKVGASGRGRGAKAGGSSAAGGPRRTRDDDDEIGLTLDSPDRSDDDSIDSRLGDEPELSDAEDDARETPAQKRLRLAKVYIDDLQSRKSKRDEDGFDAADLDRDIIADRLRQDAAAASGRLHNFIAARLSEPGPSDIHRALRGHRLPLTAAVADKSARWLYTASKDGSVAKWDLQSAMRSTDGGKISLVVHRGKQIDAKDVKGKGKEVGHRGEILCLSVDDTGAILGSGSTDRAVGVWDASGEGLVWRRGLKGHKDTVSSVAFRHGSTHCFSASLDRSLKVFDLAGLTYVETLFGHQDGVQSIDALAAEAAVSVGGRDKTCRWWKVADETQLVFRAGGTSKIRAVIEGGGAEADMDVDEAEVGVTKVVEGSTDVVAMIDHSHFLSGGDSGAIALWTTGKKKAVFTQALAHGLASTVSASEGPIRTPRWITALACLPYGDTFASGSWDGSIRLWALDPGLRSFAPLFAIPAPGFVNALQLLQPGENERPLVVAALGQEPRMGRWMRDREAKNVALVVALPLSAEVQ